MYFSMILYYLTKSKGYDMTYHKRHREVNDQMSSNLHFILKSGQISLHVCLVLQYYIESLTSAPLGHVVLLHFEIMLISYTYCINVDLKKVNPDL